MSSIKSRFSDGIMGHICVLTTAEKVALNAISQLNAFKANGSVEKEFLGQGAPCHDARGAVHAVPAKEQMRTIGAVHRVYLGDHYAAGGY
jgi:hypothetical protein